MTPDEKNELIEDIKKHLKECCDEDCGVYQVLVNIKAPQGSRFKSMYAHLLYED